MIKSLRCEILLRRELLTCNPNKWNFSGFGKNRKNGYNIKRWKKRWTCLRLLENSSGKSNWKLKDISILEGFLSFRHWWRCEKDENRNVPGESCISWADNWKTFSEIESSFQAEEARKEEKYIEYLSLISNTGNSGNEETNRNNDIGRYYRTPFLHDNNVEIHRDNLWIFESLAALDLWIGILCALLILDKNYKWSTIIPNTGVLFFLTGKYCQPQQGRNGFDLRKSGSPDI